MTTMAPQAMQEANVLYAVTSAVVTGLVVWTGAVVLKVKTVWSREAPRIVETPEEVAPMLAQMEPTLPADLPPASPPAVEAVVTEPPAAEPDKPVDPESGPV